MQLFSLQDCKLLNELKDIFFKVEKDFKTPVAETLEEEN